MGLLGLAAAGCVLAGVFLALRRSRPIRWVAVWPLMVFGFACLAANPTDFGFLIAVAILWLALAAPVEAPTTTAAASNRPRYFPRLPRARYLAPLVVLAIVSISTLTASLYWDGARVMVANGDLEAARRDADVATTLDPGEAIYHRGLGSIFIVLGAPRSAVDELQVAATLNPGDPTIFRALAIAESEAGEPQRAIAASSTSVRLQASSPPNLLLYARLLADAGRTEDAGTPLRRRYAFPHPWSPQPGGARRTQTSRRLAPRLPRPRISGEMGPQ